MQNPFADLIPQQPAQPAPGGIVVGTPRPEKPKDPPSGYVPAGNGGLTYVPGGPADPFRPGGERDPNKPSNQPKDPKLIEAERTAAFLTTNLVGNINLMNNALKQAPSQAAPTWGQKVAGFFGQDIKNEMLPAQRQVIEDSQVEILDAALTLGTGAAYTREQLLGKTQAYFPQIGDSPEAIAAKKERLRIAITAAKLKAGGAAPQIDEAMALLGLSTDPLAKPAGGEVQFSSDRPPLSGERLTREQEVAFQEFLKTKPTAAEIQAFTRSQFKVDAANAEDLAAAAAEGRISGAVDYSKMDEAARVRAQAELAAQDAAFGAPDDAGTLLDAGRTLNLSDEAAGIGRGLSRLVQGENPVEGYTLGRDAERLRIEQARERQGWGGTALEVAGGLMSANPRSVIAPFTTRNALIGQGARAGAYGGGFAGYGSGEGLEDSITRGLVGAGAGAALGAGISTYSSRGAATTNALARMEGAETAAAAARQGVPITTPNVRPGARNVTAFLEASPGGNGPVRTALAATDEGLEAAATRLSSNPAADRQSAGMAVQNSARRFIDTSRNRARTLYDRAAQLAGNATVAPQRAIQAIDNEIAELSRNPTSNQAEITFLTGFRDDLAQPGRTVDDIRNLRTTLRGTINQQNLTATQAEARAARALDAAADDIAAAVSPAAAQAYRTADRFYAQRMETIKNVVQKFTGKRDAPISGEAAYKNLLGLAVNDRQTLARVTRGLEPAERREVASSIANMIGRRGVDEPFSPALFVSQARGIPPAARQYIFGNDGAAAINDLIRVARSQTEVMGRLNNSRSGMVGQYANSLSTVLGAVGGGAAGGAAGAGVGAVIVPVVAALGRNLTANLMMSRPFTQWMARMPRNGTPAAVQQHIRRLSSVVGRESGMSSQIATLQQELNQALAPALAGEQQQRPNSREAGAPRR